QMREIETVMMESVFESIESILELEKAKDDLIRQTIDYYLDRADWTIAEMSLRCKIVSIYKDLEIFSIDGKNLLMFSAVEPVYEKVDGKLIIKTQFKYGKLY